MRLLVTRPRPQADDWVDQLRAAGWDAVALPLLDIGPPEDANAVRSAREALATFDLVVFVSPNAVARFFEGSAPPWPGVLLAGSPGPGTTAALLEAGVPAGCIVAPAADAPQFDSESLWQQLQARREWRDWHERRVLIVRGDGGRDWLARTLVEHGAQVSCLQAYRRSMPSWMPAERATAARALAEPQGHLWLLSSSEALDHLRALMPDADFGASRAVATHPRIAERARVAGFREAIELRPGLGPLLKALPTLR